MVFELNNVINSISASLLENKFIKFTVNNPLFTSLFISTIVVIIILLIFRDAEDSTRLSLRSGFWIFVFLFGYMCLYDKLLINEIEREQKQGAAESLNSKLYASTNYEGTQTIKPNFE